MSSYPDIKYLELCVIPRNFNAEEQLPELRTNFYGFISNKPSEVKKLEVRLLLINHSLFCSVGNCPYESCLKLRKLIKSHFPVCTAGTQCIVSLCASTKKLLEHQRICTNDICVICPRFLREKENNPINLVAHALRNFGVRLQVQTSSTSRTATVTSAPTSADTFEDLSDNPGKRNCENCKGHDFLISVKGHKGNCRFANCLCDRCKRLSSYRLLNNLVVYNQRESKMNIKKNEKIDGLKKSINENGEKFSDVIWKQFDANIDEAALVYAGKNKFGHAVYVGRVNCNDQLLPASFSIKNKRFYVAINGIVRKFSSGEVMLDSGYSWQKVDDGVIPKNAVVGGVSRETEHLHTGKIVDENGVVRVGAVTVDGDFHIERGFILNGYYILVKKDDEDTIAPIRQCAVCWEEAPIVGIFFECGHACLCNFCIDLINNRKNVNGKVNCVICECECYMVKKINFA